MASKGGTGVAKWQRLLNLVLGLSETSTFLTKKHIYQLIDGYQDPDKPEDEASWASFERMLERDKEELRQLGIPIDTVQTDPLSDIEDGYRLNLSQALLPELELSGDEMVVINLAMQLWTSQSQSSNWALMKRKLMAADVGLIEDDTPVLSQDLVAFPPDLPLIHQAIETRTTLQFEYPRSSDGTPKTRQLNANRLTLRDGGWYVFGHDLEADEERCYKLSRAVSRFETVGEPHAYQISSGNDQTAVLAGSQSTQTAIIAIRDEAGFELRRLGKRTTQEAPAGYSAWQIPYESQFLFAVDICRQGNDAIVLQPAELATEVVNRLKEVAEWEPRTSSEIAIETPKPRRKQQSGIERFQDMFSMITFIKNNPGVAKSELAEMFEMTEREVQETVEKIACCGPAKHWGYGSMIDVDFVALENDNSIYIDNYENLRRPFRFTPAQAFSLTAALAAIREAADEELATLTESVIDKLRVNQQTLDASSIEVKLKTGSESVISQLKLAISEGKRVELLYHDQSGTTSRPEVDLAGIGLQKGVLYAQGWSLSRNDWRTFRVDRIEKIKVLDESVMDHGQAPRLDDWGSGGWLADVSSKVTMTLSPQAGWVIETNIADSVQTYQDGTIRATFVVNSPNWLQRLLLTLGRTLVSIDPAEAIEDAKKEAVSALELYSTRFEDAA